MPDHHVGPDADFIALQAALAGEYSLEREIGRGGMGIVYLASEVRLGRTVAIKVLPPALGAQSAQRSAFLRESRIAARLNHPNIVPVHAAGERGGYAYIVMAYVDGVTLGERLRTRGPLSPGQAARLLREVAWALAYAHAAGIVHRDVSAENILLERGTDRAIVMDFGIASALQHAAIGADGRVMGNAHYVSPEQAVGEPVDARSDIYSLGVCGFYALTGRLPFDAAAPGEVVRLHLTAIPPAITSIAHTVPPKLGQAIDRCLAKDPSRRYRSAEGLAEAIDLAFEHARAIPAALRVWIRAGEREFGPRMGIVGIGAVLGLGMVSVTQSPWAFPASAAVVTLSAYLPAVGRLRRILGYGYRPHDLASALSEHQLARSEETAYELALVGSPTRSRLAKHIAAYSIRFWKGAGGKRLARFVGYGLKSRSRPEAGQPMLTEVALGRATDLLFDALPRATRRELSALPKAVKRLEDDASALRAAMSGLDDQLAVFERHAGTNDQRSAEIERELHSSRVHAAERLAATVAALENIRLDLLRLQMGSAGIESVTASLDAAQRIGEQLSLTVDARAEIERFLSHDDTAPPFAIDADDDADTPVHGVPATQG